MFGKQHTFKQFFGGIAIAAVVAVVAVPSALSMTVITDTLGGNGSAKATPDVFERSVAIHEARQARQAAKRIVAQQTQGVTLITDTLGGNGHAVQSSGSNPGAYVNGGMSPAVAQSNQTSGRTSTPSPYLYGGNSAQFTKTVQSPYFYGGDSPQFSTGNGTTSAPSVTGSPSGGTSNWGLAGLGAALAAALLLARLLIGGKGPRQPKRSIRTA